MYIETDDDIKKSKVINEIRSAIYDDLMTHEFEFFATLNLPSPNEDNAEKLLKKWRSIMCTKDKIRIAYKGVIVLSKEKGPHIHLLMIGKNKHTQTLLDKDENDWQKCWRDIAHKSAVVKKIDNPIDREEVAKYISGYKNVIFDQFMLAKIYNERFFKRIDNKTL